MSSVFDFRNILREGRASVVVTEETVYQETAVICHPVRGAGGTAQGAPTAEAPRILRPSRFPSRSLYCPGPTPSFALCFKLLSIFRPPLIPLNTRTANMSYLRCWNKERLQSHSGR